MKKDCEQQTNENNWRKDGMGIFEEAMAIEREGEAMYRRFSAKASDKGLKTIFDWLAGEEEKHYEIFQAMQSGSAVEMSENKLPGNFSEIFKVWQSDPAGAGFSVKQADLYRTALEAEKKSIELYSRQAAETPEESVKEAFTKILAEEKRHFVLLENLIEIITKPDHWTESAEFNHDTDRDYYI